MSNLRNALTELAQAYERAAETQSGWDFTREIADLVGLGLATCDLRWLAKQGHIEQACEIARSHDRFRDFCPQPLCPLTGRKCFVLSTSFATFAARVLTAKGGSAAANLPAVIELSRPPQVSQATSSAAWLAAAGHCGETDRCLPDSVGFCQPRWDSQQRALFLGPRIVKRYARPSQNQELVLAAFQEEGWPLRVDDPLPPKRELDPKRRLNKTIESLNACQENRLIAFHGDGTGAGIRWRLLAEDRGAVLPVSPALARAA